MRSAAAPLLVRPASGQARAGVARDAHSPPSQYPWQTPNGTARPMRNGLVHLPTMGSTLPATGAVRSAVSSHLPSCDNRSSHECRGEGRVANTANVANVASTSYTHPARRCWRRVAAPAMSVALVVLGQPPIAHQCCFHQISPCACTCRQVHYRADASRARVARLTRGGYDDEHARTHASWPASPPSSHAL